jgi:hypothetical protein|tara:strand:+ start:236 stop:415 length:180 start_codon:yes stop_codon:yes gene_type:complete
MNYRLFNVKIGLYENQIVKYDYQYSMDAVKEILEDNPSVFVENGGNWVFTQKKVITQIK